MDEHNSSGRGRRGTESGRRSFFGQAAAALLAAGGIRELHWHNAGEWAIMLNVSCG